MSAPTYILGGNMVFFSHIINHFIYFFVFYFLIYLMEAKALTNICKMYASAQHMLIACTQICKFKLYTVLGIELGAYLLFILYA